MGELSADESEEPHLTMVINLLVDINTQLAANKQCLDDLTAEKAAEWEPRLQNPSLACANPGISRGTTRRRVMAGPGQADHEAIPDIPDDMRSRQGS